MYLLIGNENALEPYQEPGSEALHFRPIGGEHETRFSFPPDTGLDDALRGVIASMPRHMERDGEIIWLESDVPEFEHMVMSYYGVARTKRGRPAAWGNLSLMLLGLQLGAVLLSSQLALRHRAGRDWMCRIMGDPIASGAGSYAPATWMGFSADATPPDIDDLVLVGEITEGTLARTQGIYSHTNGTAAYTLTKTVQFDQTTTLQKMALFLGPTGGSPMFSTMLDAPDPGVPGDRTQITYTATL